MQIEISDPDNLVLIKTGMHRRLNTQQYYNWINAEIMAAYASASGNKIQQRENVKATLKRLKLEIMTMNAKATF